MRFVRRPASVPLSNHQIERQITLSYNEMVRARALGTDLRECWFEDQMNGGLDVLLARGYGRS